MKTLHNSMFLHCLASFLFISMLTVKPVSLDAQITIKTIIIDNYQPYTFMNSKKIPDGFSVEIARAATQAMDLALDIRVDTWASAMRELENGGIDLLPMMAFSPERALLFDFSTPHTIAYDAIFQRKDSAKIHSLKETAGKTLIVMNKDIAHQYLVSSGLSAQCKLVVVDSLPEALRQLSQGKADAAIMPKLVGLMTLKGLALPEIGLAPPIIDNYTRPFSFAVKKNNQALLERLNQGLNIIKSNGQYETIYKKWFANLEDPQLPLKTALKFGSIAVFVLFLFMVWNLILNRRVKLKTASLRDEIEKRMVSEASLRQSEREWRLLAESMPQIVWITQGDGKNIYFNRQWVDYTGLSLEESLGDGWNEPFHPDDKQRAWEAWQSATKNRGTYALECRLRRFDGCYAWWLIRGVPVLDDKGEIVKWFGTCTDIEEMKQADAEIRQLNASLERKVSERTGQLESANREMEAFAYSVSHDLRAPLRSIDGFSLALLEDYGDRLDGNGKDYLSRVRAAAGRMGQLIDDMLKLARVTKGEMTMEPVNLSALALSAVDSLRRMEPDRAVDVSVAEGLSAKGDPSLLKVVLDNLLGNAWKFTGSHPSAHIEFGFAEIKGERAYFVRDDGAGFDMNYADKLFITFQRLHSEKEFKGTGIGLTLVQRIIRRHGGRIWAEGAVERGATFYFTLG